MKISDKIKIAAVWIVTAIGLATFIVISATNARADVTAVAQYQVLSGPTNVVYSTASNFMASLDVRRQSSVMVRAAFGMDSNEAPNVLLWFQRSADGTHWDSNLFSVTFAGVASASKEYTTNLLTYGAMFMRLNYVTNASAEGTQVTNLQVGYTIKTQAP